MIPSQASCFCVDRDGAPRSESKPSAQRSKPLEIAWKAVPWSLWSHTGSEFVISPSPAVPSRRLPFRHAIADGQEPRYIADRLGHKSTRTVLDVYGITLRTLTRLR